MIIVENRIPIVEIIVINLVLKKYMSNNPDKRKTMNQTTQNRTHMQCRKNKKLGICIFIYFIFIFLCSMSSSSPHTFSVVSSPGRQPFTTTTLTDRSLVLTLLKYEDTLIHSKTGQDVYKNPYNLSLTSLEPQKIIQRMVLAHFGFTTTETDVNMYREIYHTYPHDMEIRSSVTYLRENICLTYTSKALQIGAPIPSYTHFYTTKGTPSTNSLQTLVTQAPLTMICAFSSS